MYKKNNLSDELRKTFVQVISRKRQQQLKKFEQPLQLPICIVTH